MHETISSTFIISAGFIGGLSDLGYFIIYFKYFGIKSEYLIISFSIIMIKFKR